MHNIGTLFREIDQSTVDVEDLYNLLNSSPYVKEKENAKEFELFYGKIKFQNIKFKHLSNDLETNEKTLLNDFSLEIEPGTSNAIVGASGFGKTTLFNLLLRIYDPAEG
jgi:ABC-type multidrug transport system fused ATPase/permease subunit